MQAHDGSRWPTFSLSVTVASAVWALAASAEPVQLRPQTAVTANGVVLNPGSQAIPCVADWNGDGLPDLIVGYQPAWKVAVYINSGTLTEPAFTTFADLQAGGTDIYWPASGCGSPAPWVCDYDHDGRRDLLVGDGQYGKVYFYRNTNTDAQPILAPAVPLKLSGNDLTVGFRATPYVCDWDADGLDDLLCGDGNGYVHFFKNVGTAQAPAYASDVLLQAGGSPVNFGLRSAIRVCDWDGDGRKDLIGSGSDYAGWCRNLSSNSMPLLASAVRLQAPVAPGGLANIDTGYRMRLEVVDWNHDGTLDLLIGNYDGRVLFYEGYEFAFQSIQAEVGGVRVLAWHSADLLKYNVLGGSTVSGITNPLAIALPSGGKKTFWTNVSSDGVRFYKVSFGP